MEKCCVLVNTENHCSITFLVYSMKNSDHFKNDFQQIVAVNEVKIHRNTALHLLLSRLTTVIQINSIVAILLSILIPIALKMQISGYIVIIVGVLFGFSVGISFAIVLVQKYLCKLIINLK